MSVRGRIVRMIGVWAGTVLLLSGCGDSDEVSRAVYRASDALTTLSPDGSTPAPAGLRGETYERVSGELSSAAREGEGDIRGVAYMLGARAEMGSAQLAHHELRRLAGRMSDVAMLIQDELGVRRMHLARAGSNASYDASEDRAKVNDRIASLEEERSALVSRRDEISSRIESRRARAGELSDRAEVLRQESAEMRLEAESMDFGESRVALVERAVERGREADARAREAAGLRAESSNLAPSLDRMSREVGRVDRQLESSRDTLDRISGMVSDRRARARKARAEAESIAESIRGRASGLVELIRGEFAETYERAGSHYESALSSVSGASRGGARDGARAVRGVIEHASYAAYREAADALSVAVTTLGRARDAGVEVSELDAARDLLDRAREKAESMRESAVDSLGSSGVRGDAGDGLSRLAQKLAPAPEEGSGDGDESGPTGG